MREKTSIEFKIPVPWAAAPACIKANGRYAVIVAGLVALIIVLVCTLN